MYVPTTKPYIMIRMNHQAGLLVANLMTNNAGASARNEKKQRDAIASFITCA